MKPTYPNKINSEVLEHFLRCCHRRRHPARHSIIEPTDETDTLYYVIEGSVAVSMRDPDGREIILCYLNKGDFIGEVGVFMGEEMPEKLEREVTVKTREPCQLAQISYKRLEQVLRGELAPYATDILYALGRQLSNRLLRTSRKVKSLAFFDVTGRIAHTLIDLCYEPDAMTHPDGMQIRITRQELGRIVGCSREMAGRALKNLEDEGIIFVKGKTIVVKGKRVGYGAR